MACYATVAAACRAAQPFSTFARMAVAGQMLMAFDIDGTLVTEPSPDDSPSQRTIDAIHAAAEHGAIITVATGRGPEDALAFARRHFSTCCKYVISGNGRHIVLAARVLFHHTRRQLYRIGYVTERGTHCPVGRWVRQSWRRNVA